MTAKRRRKSERSTHKRSQGGKADPEQSKRFIEAATELGCEEKFAQFEEALERIVRARPAAQRSDETPTRAKRRKPQPS